MKAWVQQFNTRQHTSGGAEADDGTLLVAADRDQTNEAENCHLRTTFNKRKRSLLSSAHIAMSSNGNFRKVWMNDSPIFQQTRIMEAIVPLCRPSASLPRPVALKSPASNTNNNRWHRLCKSNTRKIHKNVLSDTYPKFTLVTFDWLMLKHYELHTVSALATKARLEQGLFVSGTADPAIASMMSKGKNK